MTATRRGLTLIEVVLAAALLGMVASAIFGAVSSMVAAQDRLQQRLGAAELCNRLIIQYLDDKESMPAQGGSLAYADRRYRWTYKEDPIRIKLPERRGTSAAAAASQTSAQQRQAMLDALKLVTVRVWLSEESGGSSDGAGLTPQFTMTRLVSTVNFGRNPDSFENMLSTDAGRRQIIEQLMGAGGGFPAQFQGGGPGGPGGGRRPGQGQGQQGGRPSSSQQRPTRPATPAGGG